MRVLFPVIRVLLTAAPWAMARGAALSVLVLLMGAALLGLSGWFITATGLAGLVGIGIAFDVFRPSAGVRFLALGRTAARYGERLLTHDATLRALAALRVALLIRQTGLGARALTRLRSETVLTRIISDVDALDGVVLRLLLPVFAALATHLVVFVALGCLAGWPIARAVLAGYLPLACLILWRLGRQGVAPADMAEHQSQVLRRGMIDMIRDRQALILGAKLAERETQLHAVEICARTDARTLDQAERNASAGLSILTALVTGMALVVGGQLIANGMIGPAIGAIGVFVALALAETIVPLKRGFAEYGRMVGAARRIGLGGEGPGTTATTTGNSDAPLLSITRSGLHLDLKPGMAVAITGPSGQGKSSLLMQVAGLEQSNGIALQGLPPCAWHDGALRDLVAMVPQRSALIAGTIRHNLALAVDVDDDEMWRALAAVCLADVIRERGGLAARLGEAGAGLSGGQARRLTLARAILKHPRLLLLDEPTEGLDPDTANRVLTGIRAYLPNAAILAVLHRGVDHPVFDKDKSLSL